MTEIKLYNTLTRKKEIFKSIKNKEVKLYTCGLTVYNFAHIGNLRTYIFEDILKRVLLYNGYKVKHIENITDVGHLTSDTDFGEDKMQKALKREGLKPLEGSLKKLAEKYTKTFIEDKEYLNILPPDKYTPASAHIKEMIDLIKKIEKNSYTYKTDLAVYFDTSKFKNYGKLSGQKLEEKKVAVRKEVQEDPQKRNPTDFVLWFKLAGKNKNHIMHWPSPWGEGFPGWHIECSAMSLKYLGERFDIHCGGVDHITVHHENEIAQNEAALGHQTVNFWLHGEFLNMAKIKMAKSAGGFITLQNLIDEGFCPLAFRYLCLQTHYRQKLNFSWQALKAAQNALENLWQEVRDYNRPKIGCAELEKQFLEATNDDLNIPKALAVVWEVVNSNYPNSAKKQTLLKFDKILGLGLAKVKKIKIPKEVLKLVEARSIARKQKNWAKADQLRKKIKGLGYKIEDTPKRPKIIKK